MSSEGSGVPVAEVLARVLQELEPLEPREVDLGAAAGCALADDVASPVDLPRFTTAAVDGYAVQAADVAGASAESPTLIRVVNEVVEAGGAVLTTSAGLAVRIMAGGPVPEGADAIVPLSATDGNDHEVVVTRPVEAGDGVLERGSDVRAGEVVLRAGRELRAGEVALLAATGHARVRVVPTPRVAVLPVGGELDSAGTDLDEDSTRILDASSPMLLAMLRRAGATALPRAAVGDDAKEVSRAVDAAGETADVVLTVGGTGPGGQDVLRPRLSKDGVEFADLALEPCGVVGVGRVGKKGPLVLALPGGPPAAQVGFELLVRPVLARLAGREYTAHAVPAVLARAVEPVEHREQVVPVALSRDATGGFLATPSESGSGGVGALGGADGLARVPAANPDAADPTLGAVGSWVHVLPLVELSTVSDAD